MVAVLVLSVVAALWAGDAPAVAEDDAAGALAFVVTDGEGAAVAGAEVGVWNDEDLLDAVTDEAGRALLAPVPQGRWTAWAAREGFTAEEREIEVAAGAAGTAEFKLSPGIPFSGRVVDDAGAPVADASVKAVAGGTFEGYSEMKSRPPYDRVFTEEDGTFRIRGIPPGAVSTLVVRADGLEEAHFTVRAQGGAVRPAPVEIVMQRGGVLAGRVVDAAGAPVPGAVVYVVPADEPDLIRNPLIQKWGSRGESAAAKTAWADESGAFEVAGLTFGEAVVVLADAEGHARSAPSDALTLTAGAPAPKITVRLRAGATLDVRLSTPDGEPVAQAVVSHGDKYGGGPATQTQHAPGVYRLTGLPEGELEITIESEGWLTRTVTAKTVAGKVTELAVVVDAGAALAGVVKDEEGRPVEGIEVGLRRRDELPNGGWSNVGAGAATTDAEGRFRITGLREAPHTLTASARGEYSLAEDMTVTPPQTSLVLTVRRMGSLRVRFVAPEGAPALPARTMVWEWNLDAGFGGGSQQPLEDGVLVVRGGKGTRTRLRVQFERFLPFEREVRVGWGERIDLGDVELDPGVTLRGRVVAPDGAPVAGALVQWDGQREAVTAPDGSFRLENVPGGTAKIDVEAEGFLSLATSVATAPDAEPSTLTLHRGALVSGRLVDADGNALDDHWIQFRRPPTSEDEPKGEHLDEVGTDEEGAFEVRLPAGPCRVLFVTADDVHVLATLDLVEGGRQQLTLTLGSGSVK